MAARLDFACGLESGLTAGFWLLPRSLLQAVAGVFLDSLIVATKCSDYDVGSFLFLRNVTMMGRPPKPEGEVKDVTFRIRMTRTEKDQLDRAAAVAGEDASAWARALLLRAAQKDAIPRARVRKSGRHRKSS